MNKLVKFIKLLIISLFILIPSFVYAEEKNVISGNNLASPDDEITLNVLVDSSETTIKEVKTTLTYETSVLELLSVETLNDWKTITPLSKASPYTIDATHEEGTSGESKIYALKFKVIKDANKENTTVTIESTLKEEDGTIKNLEPSSLKIEIRSRDNTLSDIKINGKTITNFSPTVTNYSIQVDSNVTSANIEATLNNKTATFVNGFAPKSGIPLEYENNLITIKVMSASQEEKSYVININRNDNRGTNNDLKNLTLNSGKVKLNFSKDTLQYTIKTHKLTDLEVVAIAEDEKAVVKIDKPNPIIIGENIVNVSITSENGKKSKTYKVIINNVDTDYDTKLSNLVFYGLDDDFKFDPNVLEYDIKYKAKYADSLVVKATANDQEEAKVDDFTLDITPGGKTDIRVYIADYPEIETIYTITFSNDTRINFFLILGIIIFIVLLIIFIKLFINNIKEKKKIKEKEKDLEKTKRLERINLE